MTAHELAQLLLAGPDHIVALPDSDGEPNANDITVEAREEPVWIQGVEGDPLKVTFEEHKFIYIF